MRHLFCLLILTSTAAAELMSDIEFAKPGAASLTLDAFVLDGDGVLSLEEFLTVFNQRHAAQTKDASTTPPEKK